MPKGIKGFQKGHKCFVTKEGLKRISEKLKGHSHGFQKGFTPWNKGKRCSEATKKKISQSCKGITAKEKNPNWKGGTFISGGYRLILKPNHPTARKDGYVREHRYIMEKMLGRLLEKFEIVHHINGDTLDNRPKNLMLFNRKTHAFHHFPKGIRFGKNKK